MVRKLTRRVFAAFLVLATVMGTNRLQSPREYVKLSESERQTADLDWSRSGPVHESVILRQECQTSTPQYPAYVNTRADDIALRGANIKVFSRVTGTTLLTHWIRGVFLRENGRVIIDGTPTFSWARHRQLAWAIVQCAKLGFWPGLETINSLADLSRSNTNLRIWNTQSESTIHDALRSLSGYVSSEYLANTSLSSGDYSFKGSEIVRHEDLMDPSFNENELDMVISTEVFEHIPFPYLAHRRVHHILKEGGVHVFTVPFSAAPADSMHASLDPEGQINFAGERIMHGDPVRPEGVPVFTIFGREMITKLCKIGFHVLVYELHIPREGILGSGAIVFIARKVPN